MFRCIFQVIILLLRFARLPGRYWMYAMQTFLYILFRVPGKVCGGISSFGRRYKFSPKTKQLRAFGCLCWYKRELHSGKLEPKFRAARSMHAETNARKEGICWLYESECSDSAFSDLFRASCANSAMQYQTFFCSWPGWSGLSEGCRIDRGNKVHIVRDDRHA